MSKAFEQIDYVYSPSGDVSVLTGPPRLRNDGPSLEDISTSDFNQLYQEANDTYGIRLGVSGQPYEMLALNTGRPGTETVYTEVTSFSGAKKNPANIVEFALKAALNPDTQHVYLGGWSNRPSRRLVGPELKHVRHKGRWSFGSGTIDDPYRPMYGVVDKLQVAEKAFGPPTYLTSDAEADRPLLGMAIAAKNLQGILLNAPDGVSYREKYVSSRLVEDFESRYKRRHLHDETVSDLSPTNIKNAKDHMPAIYHGLGYYAHIAPLYPRDVWDKAYLSLFARAYSKHNDLDQLKDHALFQDVSAALYRHDSPITLYVTTESSMHDISDCIQFGRLVMEHMPHELRTPQRRLRILVGEGTFDHQTDNPSEHAKTQRAVLGNTSFPLRQVVDNLPLSLLMNLPALEAA